MKLSTTQEELLKLYFKNKNDFDFWLSPSEQTDFWAGFGVLVFKKYLMLLNPKDKDVEKFYKESLNSPK